MNKKIWLSVFVLVPIVACLATIMISAAKKRGVRRVRSPIELRSEDITKVTIVARSQAAYGMTHWPRETVVTNANHIAMLCWALKSGEKVTVNHPSVQWECNLIVTQGDKAFMCNVCQTIGGSTLVQPRPGMTTYAQPEVGKWIESRLPYQSQPSSAKKPSPPPTKNDDN